MVQVPGLVEHLGAADPQPHRHARDRHQEPGRRSRSSGTDLAEIDRVPPRSSAIVQGRARRHVGARRAAARRALHRRRASTARPRRATASTSPTSRRSSPRAIGGENIGETIEGRRALSDQRALSARVARLARDACGRCRSSPSAARSSRSATWRSVAIVDGPPMLKSENARLSGWVYVDIRGRDLRVRRARRAARRRARREAAARLLDLMVRPVRVSRAGDAAARVVVPVTLAVIFVLLYLDVPRVDEALLIMLAVPFALVGGFWLLWMLGYDHVGRHRRRLHRARRRRRRVRRRDADLPAATRGSAGSRAASRRRDATLLAAIEEGAVLRVRPKAMTVAVIIAGLLPIMLSAGHRRRGHAAHRRADGRRHDHRAAAVDAGDSGGVPAAPPPRGLRRLASKEAPARSS